MTKRTLLVKVKRHCHRLVLMNVFNQIVSKHGSVKVSLSQKISLFTVIEDEGTTAKSFSLIYEI